MNYYVTFRHRRDLTLKESSLLLAELLRPDGRKWDVHIACVLPGQTEIIFRIRQDPDRQPIELATIVEPAKRKAGNKIVRLSGEKFPPFFVESYDRIIRDDAEFEERWQSIFDSPLGNELVEDSEEYTALYVSQAPS